MIKSSKHWKGAVVLPYHGMELTDYVTVERLYSIHYFEYMSDFKFPGESHDFWEFICVDKGDVAVTGGDRHFVLHRGEIAFHQPNEFHDVQATGTSAPNLVVIAFQCTSPAMDFFRHKILQIDETERNLLAEIVIEARRCFDCRLDDPYLQNMPFKEQEEKPGARQLIRIHLEHFLIHLLRRSLNPISVIKSNIRPHPQKTTKKKSDIELFNRVADYLETHLGSHVTIDQVCRDNLLGRSQLQKIFREQCGLGIIEYFSLMKVNAAKQLIRTNKMNFTQISEHLGYTSIHYFSRQFKKVTGMTPSEYASSIKAMADGDFKS